MLKKGFFISLITVFVLILVGIKFYPQAKSVLGLEKETKEIRIAKDPDAVAKEEKKNDKHRINRDPLYPKAMETPPHYLKEVAQKYPDKFEIMQKIYYSLDFIENAQGKVKSGVTNDYEEVTFADDYVHEMSIANLKTIQNGGVKGEQNYLAIKGNDTEKEKQVQQLPQKRVYYSTSLIKSGYFGKYVTQTQWIDLLNDFDSWHYTLGTKFNMPVYEIAGSIPPNISEQLQGPFTMTIAKETGALLDLKNYDKNNNVKHFVTIEEIAINKGISNPKQVFQLDLTNNQELPWEQYYPLTPGVTGVKK